MQVEVICTEEELQEIALDTATYVGDILEIVEEGTDEGEEIYYFEVRGLRWIIYKKYCEEVI